MCYDINIFFDQLLKDKIKRNTENAVSYSKANSSMVRRNEELKLDNDKILQHNTSKLANQILFLERLKFLFEDKKSKIA